MRTILILIFVGIALCSIGDQSSEQVLETHWRLRAQQSEYTKPGCVGVIASDIIMPFNQLVRPGEGMGGLSPVPTPDYSKHGKMYIPVSKANDPSMEVALTVVSPGWVPLVLDKFMGIPQPVLSIDSYVPPTMTRTIRKNMFPEKVRDIYGKAKLVVTSTSKDVHEGAYVPFVFRLCGRIDMGHFVSNSQKSRFGMRVVTSGGAESVRLVLKVAVLRNSGMDVEDLIVLPAYLWEAGGTTSITFTTGSHSVVMGDDGVHRNVSDVLQGYGDHYSVIGAEMRVYWGDVVVEKGYARVFVSDVVFSIDGQMFPIVWGTLVHPSLRIDGRRECAPVYADGPACGTKDQVGDVKWGVAAIIRGEAQGDDYDSFLRSTEDEVLEERGFVSSKDGYDVWHVIWFIVVLFVAGIGLFLTTIILMWFAYGGKSKRQ